MGDEVLLVGDSSRIDVDRSHHLPCAAWENGFRETKMKGLRSEHSGGRRGRIGA